MQPNKKSSDELFSSVHWNLKKNKNNAKNLKTHGICCVFVHIPSKNGENERSM